MILIFLKFDPTFVKRRDNHVELRAMGVYCLLLKKRHDSARLNVLKDSTKTKDDKKIQYLLTKNSY